MNVPAVTTLHRHAIPVLRRPSMGIIESTAVTFTKLTVVKAVNRRCLVKGHRPFQSTHHTYINMSQRRPTFQTLETQPALGEVNEIPAAVLDSN